MEVARTSDSFEYAKVVRAFGYFAIFAAAWLFTNSKIANEALTPTPFVGAALCLVLLIHGSWRVVPATMGAAALSIGIAIGPDYLDGVRFGVNDIGHILVFGACFGLPAGAYVLSRTESRSRARRAISQFLWIASLIIVGIMGAALAHGLADFLVRRNWL